MIKIRFDGPPGPVAPRFIEAEDGQGRGICIGSWEHDENSSDWFLVLSEKPISGPFPLTEEGIRQSIEATNQPDPLGGYPCPLCGRKPEQSENVTDRVDFSRCPKR